MNTDKNQSSAPESVSSDKTGQAIKEDVKQDVEAVKKAAADKFQETKQQATDVAKEKGDEATNQAGAQLEELSNTIDAVASTLKDEDREGLANYARQMSSGMNQLADRLQNQSVNELANDVKKMAKENPNGFLLGSIALGFGLSRFGKATANRDESSTSQSHDESQSNTAESATPYPSQGASHDQPQ